MDRLDEDLSLPTIFKQPAVRLRTAGCSVLNSVLRKTLYFKA